MAQARRSKKESERAKHFRNYSDQKKFLPVADNNHVRKITEASVIT